MNPKLIEEMGWRMGEVYAAVTDRILVNLAKHFPFIAQGEIPGSAWEYQVKKLAEMGQVTRETAEIIFQSMKGGDEALRDVLEASIRDSLKDADKTLKEAADRGLRYGAGFLPPELSPNQMQTFRAYYRQSADKLNLVNTVMLESTQNVYQRTVADIVERINRIQGFLNKFAGEVITGVQTLNQAVRDAVQKMVDTGITGYIDHGDHHWSPEAYVTMDIRTTAANTGRSAVFEQMEKYGTDLFWVSWHPGARPLCYPWQGKVISKNGPHSQSTDLDGNTIEVYALSETTYGEPAGLFGINCGHYPNPFIPGLSKPRQPEQNEEENAKEYEESQKQRELERNYRYAKRDLMVAKARGDEEEIAKAKKRVNLTRDNLNDFCEKTGRARRSSREQTPIQAEWPEE